jgi:hypothetical protein
LTSDVAKTDDLIAEIHSLLTSIEPAFSSETSYNDRRDQLKRQAIQVAILSQAVAEHEGPSDLKKSAPDLRDAARTLVKAKTWEDAKQAFDRAKAAADGKSKETANMEVDWGKLASVNSLMPVMKERTELIRKALRRPKDPVLESRHAMSVALVILAVHDETHAVKNAADKPDWQAICLELQGHMSRTAAAIKSKDTSSAADHFRLGMEACDKCHQKFKP